jgi:hypothetical protein
MACQKCDAEALASELRAMPPDAFHALHRHHAEARTKAGEEYSRLNDIVHAYDRELDLRQREVNQGLRESNKHPLNSERPSVHPNVPLMTPQVIALITSAASALHYAGRHGRLPSGGEERGNAIDCLDMSKQLSAAIAKGPRYKWGTARETGEGAMTGRHLVLANAEVGEGTLSACGMAVHLTGAPGAQTGCSACEQLADDHPEVIERKS